MEQLIKMVAEKANISPDQAKQAVQVVTNFIKDKLPAGINIDSILSGKSSMGNIADGLKDVGKMFNK